MLDWHCQHWHKNIQKYKKCNSIYSTFILLSVLSAHIFLDNLQETVWKKYQEMTTFVLYNIFYCINMNEGKTILWHPFVWISVRDLVLLSAYSKAMQN